ncbi:DUF402 domain-containing protein [Ornithinibacillus contaminans]|uniref:DUF402 domain-containing protein n=1 Tax=Ornithinibacillus contaminans TaxID=694055 RepID=UPI00064DEE4D|nr:DUF402 domain-containing protein [Ornithinibacillus contaminans]
MKRKYANKRGGLKPATEKSYTQLAIDTETFEGNIVLIEVGNVTEKLEIDYQDKTICILNHHYSWLQQFPTGKNHVITTIFNELGNIVQWYIDICFQHGVENNIPFLDDLYLDIVVLPTGETYLLDEDELEEALLNGDINRELYDLAWAEVTEVMKQIEAREFTILELANEHRMLLQKNKNTRPQE